MTELPRYPGPPVATSAVGERDVALMWRQVGGQALDGLVVLAPLVTFWGSVSWHRAVSGPDDWQLPLWILVIGAGYLWLLLAWPLYETISVAACGRTLGQAMTGIRVVTSWGDRVGFGGALGRAVLVSWTSTAAGTLILLSLLHWPPVVPLVAFGWICASMTPLAVGRRSCFDAATGTTVVRTSRTSYWQHRAS